MHVFTENHKARLEGIVFVFKRPPWLGEFAKVTEIPTTTCCKWAQQGKLPAIKVEGRWQMVMARLEDWEVPDDGVRLSDAKAREIRRLSAEGDATLEDLAIQFGVSASAISGVRSGRLYRE